MIYIQSFKLHRNRRLYLHRNYFSLLVDTEKAGFTLIELSIVLVIIGLIIGAILTGRDLIDAAAQRAQITQIEKYNTAANTFVNKFGYLPGDIPNPLASQFGFLSRGAFRGEGDGNGLLEGIDGNTSGDWDSAAVFSGENAMFWVDLSTANMVDGSFNTATPTAVPTITTTNIAQYAPVAKIGNGNYIFSNNGGWGQHCGGCGNGIGDSFNYFSVNAMTNNQTGFEYGNGNTTITVIQAYNIDKKVDDGLPQSGLVMAVNIGSYGSTEWSAGNHLGGAADASGGPVVAGDGVSTAASVTTCYDNNSVAGATEHYSTQYQNGTNANCALTFRMQGAAR